MDYPNTYYHVLSQGNERREIFHDDCDSETFKEKTGETADFLLRFMLMY